MTKEEIDWGREGWTKRAYKLLEGIHQFPKDKKIILIMRHSHRYDSEDIRNHMNDYLTPIGHKYANGFGKNLPKDRTIRIYHSVIERCRETATNIVEGFNYNDTAKVEIKGSLDVLYDLEISEDNFYREATKYSLDRLLYRWAAGLYPPEMIPPIHEYAIKAANTIWTKLKEGNKKSIDIHVTHDLILLCLRLGWFGLPKDKWPSFLSGFAFTFNEDEILLYDYDHFKSIEIPYWWRRKEN
ncbi:MAG: histidine phosphatase family protein [Promethearchaeota archaeon]|nr:MAG: histidine phosphatase family protein [Candidatus Lokiarchaeota archaeon]